METEAVDVGVALVSWGRSSGCGGRQSGTEPAAFEVAGGRSAAGTAPGLLRVGEAFTVGTEPLDQGGESGASGTELDLQCPEPGAGGRGPQPVVADPVEAGGQDVLQVAAHEFVRSESHGAQFARFVVAVLDLVT